MKLTQLLEGFEYECLQGSLDKDITSLEYDSRNVKDGSLFICISGAVSDGHVYASAAAAAGAAAILAEHEIDVPENVTVIKTADTRIALAHASAAWFGHPARELTTIGITGTKGKTTTTYMIKSILEHSGFKTGLIGTIETIIGDEHIHADNTTPESYVIQESFRKMADAGCKCVVMEVSSQGLMLHRVGGFTFDYGIFSNIEPDHIGPNEHKDFEDYINCKAMLFKQCRHGIFNGDDEHLERILKGHTCTVSTFGFGEDADFRAQDARLFRSEGTLGVSYKLSGKLDMDVKIDIPGKFSVYNSLAAISLCFSLGAKAETIKDSLANIHVRGRVELVPVSPKFTLMIDYAHNAMSLESLLTTLREYNPGRLVCVFGCGGNRSRDRRFQMGEVSSRLADLTIATSDNPRFEEPQAILDDIITGIKKADGKYIAILDREEAIRYAVKEGLEGDIIVIAGKGHEDYQEIKGIKYHMDDRELVEKARDELL